mmetsp:Transcript_57752/g.162912  ORF Transcript_57752/g.162912 Transcript_57752/m.162912 type:complete len:170 (-) Transcript_57752:172-681(-)
MSHFNFPELDTIEEEETAEGASSQIDGEAAAAGEIPLGETPCTAIIVDDRALGPAARAAADAGPEGEDAAGEDGPSERVVAGGHGGARQELLRGAAPEGALNADSASEGSATSGSDVREMPHCAYDFGRAKLSKAPARSEECGFNSGIRKMMVFAFGGELDDYRCCMRL